MAHARRRWRGHVAGGHADAREGRHMARRAGSWRAHGLVGPGNRIGAVTQ